MNLPHDEFNDDEWIYHTMNLTTMNLPHDECNDDDVFTTRWI